MNFKSRVAKLALVMEVVETPFLVRWQGQQCMTSIGEFHVVVTEAGAVYAMKCGQSGPCVGCEDLPIDDGVVVSLPHTLYRCLGCILGELFNAGFFNVSFGGVVAVQRRAFVVPPMAKERGDVERLVKRARGILENYLMEILAASFGPCCKF